MRIKRLKVGVTEDIKQRIKEAREFLGEGKASKCGYRGGHIEYLGFDLQWNTLCKRLSTLGIKELMVQNPSGKNRLKVNRDTFGQNIKFLRTHLKLRQKDVTPHTPVSNWERGINLPNYDSILYIMNTLNIKELIIETI